jgi:hypothetical protein
MRVAGKSWIKKPSLYQYLMGGCGKKSESFQRSDFNRFLSWASSQKPISSSSHLADITPPSFTGSQASGRVSNVLLPTNKRGFCCSLFRLSGRGGKEKRG